MSRRGPLPSPYDGGTFRTRDAIAAGVSVRRLRDPALRTRHTGVRSDRPVDSPVEAARQAGLALSVPHAFSHTTAARLLGMPLPDRWSPDEPIHLVTPGEGHHVRRPGVVGHRGLEHRTTTRLRSGLLVTGSTDTWSDLATILGVDDLIAAGDWVVRPRSTATPADLQAAIRPGMRGARPARLALAEIRPGSASPMETRARLQCVRAGLPEPELNADVVHDGCWVACVDLLWRRWGVVVEYDGRHHIERERTWAYDVERDRELRRVGLTVVHLTARDVLGPRPRTAALVREALVGAGWRPGA